MPRTRTYIAVTEGGHTFRSAEPVGSIVVIWPAGRPVRVILTSDPYGPNLLIAERPAEDYL
ncbi:hypothetical protein [Streptomyces pseudogriseolus]|uniref:hypothetical protein n=1 Tax=Streptomyces pseudogriseolus TaxID=36817 RepID=UPI003FA2D574